MVRTTLWALRLFPVDELDWDEACGLFRVYKDDSNDRLILNPTLVNSRMDSIPDSTRRLGQGFSFTRISIAPGEWAEISSDDLRGMYYTFRVSPDRARRNALRVAYPVATFHGWSARGPRLECLRVAPALNALAMGDNLAVEIANAAHEGLLLSIGALHPSEQLVHRRPCPRGPFYETLNIDDHIGLQKLRHGLPPPGQVSLGPRTPRPSSPSRRDVRVFAACDAACDVLG